MNIICFGDSNTYGFDPRSFLGSRYEAPWPLLLGKKTGWNVINYGENGRTIPKNSVIFPQETNYLIIMLGTNDLLQSNTPDDIVSKMRKFLSAISLSRDKIILIAPPPMCPGKWVPNQAFTNDSMKLTIAYRKLSKDLNVCFADAGEWGIALAYDGVHFTQEGHRVFSERLSSFIDHLENIRNYR